MLARRYEVEFDVDVDPRSGSLGLFAAVTPLGSQRPTLISESGSSRLSRVKPSGGRPRADREEIPGAGSSNAATGLTTPPPTSELDPVMRGELASAIFEWIEGWYNPRRCNTS